MPPHLYASGLSQTAPTHTAPPRYAGRSPLLGPDLLHHGAHPPITDGGSGFDPFRVLLGTLLALILSAFLASSSMLDIAQQMEFGPSRDRWLVAAETVDAASHNLYTDRPADWMRGALGYDDAPDTVILGDLAVTDAPLELAAASQPETLPAAPSVSGEGEIPGAEGSPTATPAPAPIPVSAPEPEPTPEPALREVSEAEPLRIWMGGDSLGQFMAGHVAYRVAPPERTDIQIDYHISTGLARPDYYDWPARFTEIATSENRPEAFIFMVGGNDDQAMKLQNVVLDPATPEWREEYRRRVGLLMDVVAYPDARLIWVLLPPMQEPRRAGISEQVNEMIRMQAALRPWVSAIEIEDLFLDSDGRYAQFVDGPEGAQQLARKNDGVHITETGSAWVAARVWTEVQALWPTVAPQSPDAPAS